MPKKILPDAVQAQMKKPRVLKSDTILLLVDSGGFPYVTLDTLVREFYLTTDMLIKRHSMVQHLYDLRRKGFIEVNNPGEYFITKKGGEHLVERE